jgi:hypothetical protein
MTSDPCWPSSAKAGRAVPRLVRLVDVSRVRRGATHASTDQTSVAGLKLRPSPSGDVTRSNMTRDGTTITPERPPSRAGCDIWRQVASAIFLRFFVVTARAGRLSRHGTRERRYQGQDDRDRDDRGVHYDRGLSEACAKRAERTACRYQVGSSRVRVMDDC